MPIPYGKQCISVEDIEAVIVSLTGDYLTQGPTIYEFEKAFAEYVGSSYAIALANGTAALHLSAMARSLDAVNFRTPKSHRKGAKAQRRKGNAKKTRVGLSLRAVLCVLAPLW